MESRQCEEVEDALDVEVKVVAWIVVKVAWVIGDEALYVDADEVTDADESSSLFIWRRANPMF